MFWKSQQTSGWEGGQKRQWNEPISNSTKCSSTHDFVFSKFYQMYKCTSMANGWHLSQIKLYNVTIVGIKFNLLTLNSIENDA